MKIITNDGTEYIIAENSIAADIITACVNAANSYDIEQRSPVNSDTLKLFDPEGNLIPFSAYKNGGIKDIMPYYAFLGTREAYDMFVNEVRNYGATVSPYVGSIAVWYDYQNRHYAYMDQMEYSVRKNRFDVYKDVACKLHLGFVEYID